MEGPYKLPEGWQWVELGEVCEIWDNLRRPVKKKLRNPGEIPYCGANGVIDYVSGYTHEGEFVLLAEDGGFYGPGERTAYLMRGRFWANNHVHIVRGKPDLLTNTFLLYWLIATDLHSYLTGATRPKLTQSAMRNLPIPLPPLEEQRRIIARIEELMGRVREARRLQEEAKKDADRLWQATLAEVFPRPGSELAEGWRWVKLGEVARIFSGTWGAEAVGTPPPGQTRARVVRVSDIKENYTINYYTVPVRQVRQTEATRLTLITGDIIVVKSSGSKAKVISGRAAIFSKQSELYIPSNFVFALRINFSKAQPEFLWYWLNSDHVKHLVESMVSTFTYPNLKKTDYCQLPVPLPPLPEQQRIVAYLDSVQEKVKALKRAQEQTETELQRLEQAILAGAFKGEL